MIIRYFSGAHVLLHPFAAFKICLGLLLACAFQNAHSTEYTRPQKLYATNATGIGPFTDVREAATAISAYGCTGFYTNCSVGATSEKWGGWEAVHYYAYTSAPTEIYTAMIRGPNLYICPTGWTLYNTAEEPRESFCTRPDQPVPPCDDCDSRRTPQLGNPISLSAAGVKQQIEVDYENAQGTLKFIRTYRSDLSGWTHNYQRLAIDFSNPNSVDSTACFTGDGTKTGEPYCYPILGRRTVNNIGIRRANGSMRWFGDETSLNPSYPTEDRISKVLDQDGITVGYTYWDSNTGTTEKYDLTGRIITSSDRSGKVSRFAYSDALTPQEIAPAAGLLLSVTDHFGNQLRFTYDSKSRLKTMTDPAGGIYTYTHNEEQNLLESVQYPDGKTRRYIHGEVDKTSNTKRPRALTGIIDEKGNRFATFTYDTNGKPQSTEHAGGVLKYSIVDGATKQTVTDPLGTVRTYNFITAGGRSVLNSLYQPSPTGTGTVYSSSNYDANANVTRHKDFDDSLTTYSYNLSRNLEIKRTEASGTTVARIIQTEWHPDFRLPTRIAEPKRITSYTYDDRGNLLTETVQATSDANGSLGFSATTVGTPRTWTYTYNEIGQRLTAKGPRADVNDLTRYTYSPNGNLETITNAAGHVTTLSDYDAHGRAGKITDPNGLVTTYAYTPRGWLSSVSTGGESTIYDYYETGKVRSVSLPSGPTLYYQYDEAQRLTEISDTFGNKISYTLDNMGNRISEKTTDSTGALVRNIERIIDPLNRVKQVTGALQ